MFFISYYSYFLSNVFKLYLVNFKRLMLNNIFLKRVLYFDNSFLEISLSFKKNTVNKILCSSFSFLSTCRNLKFHKNELNSIISFRQAVSRRYYLLRNKQKLNVYFRRSKFNKLKIAASSLRKFVILRGHFFSSSDYLLLLKDFNSTLLKSSVYTPFNINPIAIIIFFFLKSKKSLYERNFNKKLLGLGKIIRSRSRFRYKNNKRKRIKYKFFRKIFFFYCIKSWRFTRKIRFLKRIILYVYKSIKIRKIFKTGFFKNKAIFNKFRVKIRLRITFPKLIPILRPIQSFFIKKSTLQDNLYYLTHSRFIFLETSSLSRLCFIKNSFRSNIIESTISITSRNKTFFILQNIGLLLPLRFLYKFKKHLDFYRLRKKIFSFLKPNEYKMHIFNFRKKYLKWQVFFTKKIGNFTFSKFSLYNFFKYEFCTVLNISYNNFIKKLFINEKILNIHKDFTMFYNRDGFFSREVRIPRVRFKPGYQRLWRNYRQALAELINFKYLYQKQLTKYITCFYRKINQSHILDNENFAYRILIYSKLVPDLNSFYLLFNNKLVFLNNQVLARFNIYVYTNDYLQIEVSNWYYVFFRWLSNSSKNRQRKLRKLVFRKSLPNKYKLMKQKKQRSNYTPNWIFSTEYDFRDVKSFLEVDFMTLSVFVVYDHNEFFFNSPLDIKIVRYNIYKMYNWKYVV